MGFSDSVGGVISEDGVSVEGVELSSDGVDSVEVPSDDVELLTVLLEDEVLELEATEEFEEEDDEDELSEELSDEPVCFPSHIGLSTSGT